MLHHHRFRDFLVLFEGFLELHLWEACAVVLFDLYAAASERGHLDAV